MTGIFGPGGPDLHAFSVRGGGGAIFWGTESVVTSTGHEQGLGGVGMRMRSQVGHEQGLGLTCIATCMYGTE